MDVALQLMTGVSLAACAGLRAWLPLFVTGLLGRAGVLPLDATFDLLTRTDALVIFGVATVLEVLGDKVVVVDHFLDAAGTFLRPVAGTVLAASVLTHLDPALSLALGLIVGGGTALTVHSGKAALRATGTTTAPVAEMRRCRWARTSSAAASSGWSPTPPWSPSCWRSWPSRLRSPGWSPSCAPAGGWSVF